MLPGCSLTRRRRGSRHRFCRTVATLASRKRHTNSTSVTILTFGFSTRLVVSEDETFRCYVVGSLLGISADDQMHHEIAMLLTALSEVDSANLAKAIDWPWQRIGPTPMMFGHPKAVPTNP